MIFGHTWDQIQRAQRKEGSLHEPIKPKAGDYGADPMGDGMFRMAPSGDIVGYDERCRRLAE